MRRFVASCFCALITAFAHAQNASDYFGRFEGELILKPLAKTGEMRLMNDYSFIDPAGGRWDAPAGTISDGASIPRYLWIVLGDPWGADYRNAAVIHDVACKRQDRPWETVHLTFYYAMLAAGVSELKADIMYQGVHRFGPRWGRRPVASTPGTTQTKPVPYSVPTRTMSAADYAEIEQNAKLIGKIKGLSASQRAAVLQEPGQLNEQRIERAAQSEKARVIQDRMTVLEYSAIDKQRNEAGAYMQYDGSILKNRAGAGTLTEKQQKNHIQQR